MRAIIGMGSNVGDRLAHLRSAVKRLEGIGHVERVSHVYETKPVGGPPQGDYLNAAARIVYDGEPLHLLDALQGIEAILGRVRDDRYEKWGARTLDLDILWVEGIAMESDRLVIPHPRLVERPFALRPLVDVTPDAIDPLSQLPYTRLFDEATAHMVPTALDLFGAS